MDQRELVQRIRREIESEADTRAGRDRLNALKIYTGLVFTRPSHFVMEFIQNAEDVGATSLEISLSERSVKVVHDGRPFDHQDADALCGMSSTKTQRPDKLGYLGIGFKSAFVITESPHIFSGGFRFKFDKGCWPEPHEVPWEIMPLWVESPPECLDLDRTTFVLPLKKGEGSPAYIELKLELRGLIDRLHLFLRNLRSIVIKDDTTDESWMYESQLQPNGIARITRNGDVSNFRVFGQDRVWPVPPDVKRDELTQKWRPTVQDREVTIAFEVDGDVRLKPVEAGVTYGSLYSFLPMGQEWTGAKFLIQGDFLVLPGREGIAYDAPWNHWLMDCAAEVAKEAISHFKRHDQWRYQFMPLFGFQHFSQPSFQRLFGPHLVHPLEQFLKEENTVLTEGGSWEKPSQVVRLSDQGITDLLGPQGLDELFEEEGLQLVHPEFQLGPMEYEVKRLERGAHTIIENESFLQSKAGQPGAPEWFRKLYIALNKEKYSKSSYFLRDKGYSNRRFILTADAALKRPSDKIYLLPADTVIPDAFKDSPIIHPAILAGASEPDRQSLEDVLVNYAGVRRLDLATIAEEEYLPHVRIDAPKPSKDTLLRWTRGLFEAYKAGWALFAMDIWVLTRDGEVKPSKDVWFSSAYSPEHDWELHRQYLAYLSFLSPEYLAGVTDPDERNRWRALFEQVRVNDGPEGQMVKHFAEECVKDLSPFRNFVAADPQKAGYDFIAETESGDRRYIEVKGRSDEPDIDLTAPETEAAKSYGDRNVLCVVTGIPNTPQLYVVPDPYHQPDCHPDKLTVPRDVYTRFRVRAGGMG